MWYIKKDARLMFVCAQVFVSICMCACALGVGLMMPKMSKMKFLLYGILKFDKGNNHAND